MSSKDKDKKGGKTSGKFTKLKNKIINNIVGIDIGNNQPKVKGITEDTITRRVFKIEHRPCVKQGNF